MATPQSPLQQLIQNLAGVQTTAQQNSQNSANNGNPNTVYNQPGWGYGGIPTTNTQGQIAPTQYNPAARLNALNLAPYTQGWSAPEGGVPDFSFAKPVIPAGGIVTNPNWPTTTPGTGGGGGTVTPPTGGGGGVGTGGNGGLGVGNPPVTGGNNLGDPIWFDRDTTNYVAPGYESDVKNVVNEVPADSKLGFYTTQLGQNLGLTENGMDWQQIVDLLSEPWLQGDLYMSQTGEWNEQNVLKALVNTILPGGGNLLGFLAEKGLFGKTVQNWFFQGNISQGLNKLAAQIAKSKADIEKKLNEKPLRPPRDPGSLGRDEGSGGCVCVYTKLLDYDSAEEVGVDDEMTVSDPLTGKHTTGIVSYSETKTMPCVRITTASGITLDCSTTAPIADVEGNQVLAPNLFDKVIPVVDHGEFRWERVVKLEMIGEQLVQHITVENNFFLAGNDEGRYIFHHNIKSSGQWGVGPIFGPGFWEVGGGGMWGNVGPVEQVK